MHFTFTFLNFRPRSKQELQEEEVTDKDGEAIQHHGNVVISSLP
jgi:hypothetical protein